MASSDHLKPGEKVSITTKVSTAQKSGMLLKTIRVLTNDPKNQTIVLTIKAFVKRMKQSMPIIDDRGPASLHLR